MWKTGKGDASSMVSHQLLDIAAKFTKVDKNTRQLFSPFQIVTLPRQMAVTPHSFNLARHILRKGNSSQTIHLHIDFLLSHLNIYKEDK